MFHNLETGSSQDCCQILVADDDPLIRETIEMLLTSHFPSLEVLHASDGLEATKLAMIHQPDLILLDGHMPVVSGDRAAARLRQADSTRAIPLVAISGEIGHSAMGDRLRALCDLCLAKPFSPEELIAIIEQGLNGHRPPSHVPLRGSGSKQKRIC